MLTFKELSDVSPMTYLPLRISSLPFLELLCYAVDMTAYLNFCDLRLLVGPLKILSILKFVLKNPTLYLPFHVCKENLYFRGEKYALALLHYQFSN